MTLGVHILEICPINCCLCSDCNYKVPSLEDDDHRFLEIIGTFGTQRVVHIRKKTVTVVKASIKVADPRNDGTYKAE